jgi:hypothetical protein
VGLHRSVDIFLHFVGIRLELAIFPKIKVDHLFCHLLQSQFLMQSSQTFHIRDYDIALLLQFGRILNNSNTETVKVLSLYLLATLTEERELLNTVGKRIFSTKVTNRLDPIFVDRKYVGPFFSEY